MTNHDEIARRIVDREVRLCLSSLVGTLAEGQGCVAPAFTRLARNQSALAELCEQAAELSYPIPDYESAAREAGWAARPATVNAEGVASDPCIVRGTTDEDDEHATGFKYAGTWQDACEADQIEPYEREVFEHWAVSDWLADKLIAKGEKVDKDFAGLCVWARTTTGQAIYCDGVIQDIAADIAAKTEA